MLLKQFLYVLLTVLIHSNNVLSADPVPAAGQVAAPANPAAAAPANPAAAAAATATTPAVNPEEAVTTETPLTPEVNPVETTPTIPTTPATVPEAVNPTTETTETPIAPPAATVETSSSSSTTTAAVPPTEALTDTTNTAVTNTGTTTTPTVDTLTTGTETGTDTSETKELSSSSSSSSSVSSEKPKETINPDLVSDKIFGTWSSKANTVFTGPGFYDPVDELLIEPALPGISYSFTEDGYWEEAIYQVSPNPRNHSCPAAVLIFQHGTYTMGNNGSLILTPFEVDGRQLLSEPCSDGGVSIYSRYKQIEEFKGYQVYVDPYHGRWRLDLIKSNGEIMQPLYLAYQPPQMLPTITMNPTADATGNSKGKRELNEVEVEFDLSLAGRVKRSLENQYRTNAILKDSTNYAVWWWSSVTMIAVGAGLFVFS
ncbi:hypothetical protein CANINC_004783 [Pichia inconspicua]|uniref:Protein ROT1 n=1 Tax=Pichia inconspicua TaxID=52247 RepID=A0A4V4NF40_9ASCO|nr:hypothetical protein CANINC_004783 [[Candida] inconspicua]